MHAGERSAHLLAGLVRRPRERAAQRDARLRRLRRRRRSATAGSLPDRTASAPCLAPGCRFTLRPTRPTGPGQASRSAPSTSPAEGFTLTETGGRAPLPRSERSTLCLTTATREFRQQGVHTNTHFTVRRPTSPRFEVLQFDNATSTSAKFLRHTSQPVIHQREDRQQLTPRTSGFPSHRRQRQRPSPTAHLSSRFRELQHGPAEARRSQSPLPPPHHPGQLPERHQPEAQRGSSSTRSTASSSGHWPESFAPAPGRSIYTCTMTTSWSRCPSRVKQRTGTATATIIFHALHLALRLDPALRTRRLLHAAVPGLQTSQSSTKLFECSVFRTIVFCRSPAGYSSVVWPAVAAPLVIRPARTLRRQSFCHGRDLLVVQPVEHPRGPPPLTSAKPTPSRSFVPFVRHRFLDWLRERREDVLSRLTA